MELPAELLPLLPEDSFYLVSNGKPIADVRSLVPGTDFKVIFRLRGGKGGFGSLLRSFGSQFCNSTNQDACRDLTGRRLRDVKEEEKLKKWIEKAGEREREKQRKHEEKIQRLKHTPKHMFEDNAYFKTKESILEMNEEAVQEGIKAALLNPELAGSSGSSEAIAKASADGRKRKNADAKPDKSSSKKPKGLWLGTDLAEGDLSSSSSESEIEEPNTSVVANPSIEGVKEQQEDSNGSSHSSCAVIGFQDVHFVSSKDVSSSESSAAPSPQADLESRDQSEETGQGAGLGAIGAGQSDLASTPILKGDVGAEKKETMPTEDSPAPPPVDVQTQAKDPISVPPETAKSANVPTDFNDIDLSSYSSADELWPLGLEHLKAELTKRGLKCGGSLPERAERLWAVRNLAPGDYPAQLLAKKK